MVDDPDDVEKERELHHPVLVGLQLVDGGDDEGDSGDEHHGQREEGAEPELFVIWEVKDASHLAVLLVQGYSKVFQSQVLRLPHALSANYDHHHTF